MDGAPGADEAFKREWLFYAIDLDIQVYNEVVSKAFQVLSGKRLSSFSFCTPLPTRYRSAKAFNI